MAWLQSINPIFIIIFAPIFAALWTHLGSRAPSTPAKFAIALFGVGLSFLIMIPPAMAADSAQESAMWWLVGCLPGADLVGIAAEPQWFIGDDETRTGRSAQPDARLVVPRHGGG